MSNAQSSWAAELAKRLEWFRSSDSEIDLDAWCELLDCVLPPEEQDDAHAVRAAWARWLTRHVNRALYGDRRPCKPTRVLPGPQKVAILRQRLEARQALWHPDDATYLRNDGEGLPVSKPKNSTLEFKPTRSIKPHGDE